MDTRSQRKRKLEDVKAFGIRSFKDEDKLLMKILQDEDRPTQLRSGKILSHEHPAKRKRKDASNVEVLPNSPLIASDLALYLCFKYFTVEDLINSQFVCQQWNRIIQDPNLWKNKVWRLQEAAKKNDLYKRHLVNAPLIQNIVIPRYSFWSHIVMQNHIHKNSEALETVLLHQEDVRSLEAYLFQPNLMHKLVAKFKNLESLTIGICCRDMAITVKALKSCEQLQKLHIVRPVKCYGESFPSDINKIARLLGDYFTSLKDLDLTYFQSFLNNEDIIYIVGKKVNQLKKLKLSCKEDTSCRIFEIISQSWHLELYLKVSYRIFDLNILQSLKSVTLEFGGQDLAMDIFLEDTVLPNVKNFMISWEECDTGPGNTSISLKSTVASFPNTKYVKIDFLDDDVLNNELVHLSGFPYLKTVCLNRAYNLNVDGLSHLARCSGLESLTIAHAGMTKDLLKAVSLCSRLSNLELNGYWHTATTEDVLLLISSLDRLRSFKLSPYDRKCYPLLSISAVKQKCKEQNISLETRDRPQIMVFE